MLRSIIKGALIGAGLLSLFALPANAKNLLTTTFPGVQTFSTQGFAAVFPSGSFSQAFFTETDDVVMISFSAICSTSGPAGAYTSVQILIDGSAIYPNALLCSSLGAATNTTELGTYSFITAREVKGQNVSHDIKVRVTPRNGVSRIQSLNLLVWD
jgi:hypothetical protein